MTARMHKLSGAERAAWARTWAETLWEVATAHGWEPLPHTGAWVLVSAWNPGCQRLPTLVNQARDAVLHAELLARGLTPQRSRGRAADGSWSEDGWMFALTDMTSVQKLLARYGQLAGLAVRDGARSLVWCEE